MISLSSNIRFERLSTKIAPTMHGITTLDEVPAKKKHITKTKEIVTTVPKTIVLPTPSTPTRHLFKTPVTLAIGPTNHPFHLHLEALCSISPFFSAAFNPAYSFRESVTSTLSLPECNPTDFEYFAQWLYTRTLTHESLDGPHPAYFKLIKLWKLASFLGITALKNSIVDELGWRADETNSVPTPDDTRSLWGGEEEMGGLKELVVDLFAWKKTDALVQGHPDSWDERFLRELVGRLKRKGKDAAPWRDNEERCRRYHEHDRLAPMCEGVEVLKEE